MTNLLEDTMLGFETIVTYLYYILIFYQLLFLNSKSNYIISSKDMI